MERKDNYRKMPWTSIKSHSSHLTIESPPFLPYHSQTFFYTHSLSLTPFLQFQLFSEPLNKLSYKLFIIIIIILLLKFSYFSSGSSINLAPALPSHLGNYNNFIISFIISSCHVKRYFKKNVLFWIRF